MSAKIIAFPTRPVTDPAGGFIAIVNAAKREADGPAGYVGILDELRRVAPGAGFRPPVTGLDRHPVGRCRHRGAGRAGAAAGGQTLNTLEPDRDQIARFVEALFRHAKPDGFVSLRSFTHDDKVWRMRTVRLDGSGFEDLISAAVELAAQCANADERIVFCPPVCTFRVHNKARNEDLINGLVISVECDANPAAARATLEALLGPATVVVASGGEWTDPETGEVQDKLHLYWRLTQSTREPEEHEALRRAREAATRLVGADATNIAVVHPIRWPGSWHRKGSPRLARIVAISENEIALADALAALPAVPEGERQSGEPEADIENVEIWLDIIPNRGGTGATRNRPALPSDPFGGFNWHDWNTIGMATYRATGGSAKGLELFQRWSDKHPVQGRETPKSRWEHYGRHPPTSIGAGTLAYLADVFFFDPDLADAEAYLYEIGELP